MRDVEVAESRPGLPELVLDHLPRPRRPPASRRAARRGAGPAGSVCPAKRWPGGQARTTSSWKNGSNVTPGAAGPLRRCPSSSSRSATRSTTVCVSETASRTRTSGFRAGTREEQPAAPSPQAPTRRRARGVPQLAAGVGRDLVEELLLEREQRLRAAVERSPASVGSTRRPERSSSWRPSRCSSDRICRLTAGCVTPSRSAACEKLLRSTTAQNAAS